MKIKRSYTVLLGTVLLTSLLYGCGGGKKPTSTKSVDEPVKSSTKEAKKTKILVPVNSTVKEIPLEEIKAVNNDKKTLYYDGFTSPNKEGDSDLTIDYITDDSAVNTRIIKSDPIITDLLDSEHSIALDTKGQLYLAQRDYKTNKFFVMRLLNDGTRQKIVEIPERIDSMYFTVDKLYILAIDDNIYSVNLDGSDLKKLGGLVIDQEPAIVGIYNNTLILSDYNGKKYRRADLDNLSQSDEINDKNVMIEDTGNVTPVIIHKGFIYVNNDMDDTGDNLSISRINIDTNVLTKIVLESDSSDYPEIIGIKNEKLYYTRTSDDTQGIYTCDLDGKNEKRLNSAKVDNDGGVIKGDYIYLTEYSGIWMYTLDGSAGTKIYDTEKNKIGEEKENQARVYRTKYPVSENGLNISELETAFFSENYIYYLLQDRTDNDTSGMKLIRSNLDGSNRISIVRYHVGSILTN